MKKHLAVLIALMILISLAAGCTKAAGPDKGSTPKTGTAETSTAAEAVVPGKGPLDPVYKKYIIGEKTGYFVPADNGEHSYLKKDHPLVQEVAAAVEGFCRDSSNRDYRNSDGKEDYQWYTKEVVEQLLIKKDPENTLAEFKKYQVVEKEVSSIVDGIMFSTTGKAAQVAFENKIRWESGTKEFLEKNKVSLNTDYLLQGVAVLIKENGRWKFQGVTYSKPQPAEK